MTDVAAIRTRLQVALDATLARLRGLPPPEQLQHPGSAQFDVDMDAVAGSQAEEMTARDRERLLVQTHEIRLAMGRLDAGEYGVCVACGERIPEKRLVAVSWASRCVRCEAARERGEAAEPDRVGVARVHRPTTRPLEELGE